MNNFSNIDKAKLQQMLNAVASQKGLDANKLSSAMNSGNLNSVLSSLGGANSKEIKNILNNKQALDSILNSPEAQKLMRELSK